MLETIGEDEYPTVQITLQGEVVDLRMRPKHQMAVCEACGEEFFEESIIDGICDLCGEDIEGWDDDDI